MRDPMAKVMNFYEDMVPKFYTDMYKRTYRMMPDSVTLLSNFLYEPRESIFGCEPVDFTKQVNMTLHYLGSKDITYR